MNIPESPFSIPFVLVLLLLFSFSCGEKADDPEVEKMDNVMLEFSAMVGKKEANCKTEYTLGMQGTTVQLADARIFISEVEYKNKEGAWIPAKLIESDWQYKNLALLDFEDATGACKESGTINTNRKIKAMLKPGNYTKVRFSLGVPFELNHIDNATAPSPLNTPGMFWVWQGGYKFARIDWKVSGGDVPRFNTHIGSTHCKSDNKTAPPQDRCGHPNLAKLEFDISSQIHNKVMLDLEKMVLKTDLGSNAADSPPGCMSDPKETEDCGGIYNALGLSFSDGKCEDACSKQSAFSLMGHH